MTLFTVKPTSLAISVIRISVGIITSEYAELPTTIPIKPFLVVCKYNLFNRW
jgi:hypothetical protein